MAIMVVPSAFWALIVAFMVVVLGGRRDVSEHVEAVDVEEPVTEPVREPAPVASGLGWRPPLPSHH